MNSTIRLCIDPYEPTLGFWVEVTTTYNTDEVHYVTANPVSFSGVADDEGHYHLTINLNIVTGNEAYEYPLEHYKELGVLSAPNGTEKVFVDIFCGNARLGVSSMPPQTILKSANPVETSVYGVSITPANPAAPM
jgi:hypothetical protein